MKTKKGKNLQNLLSSAEPGEASGVCSLSLSISRGHSSETQKTRTISEMDSQLSNHSLITHLSRRGVALEGATNTGISTELKLYEDPWKITKKLTNSDLGNLSRLLVGSNAIEEHILPFMDNDQVNEVDAKGLQVAVFDINTLTGHALVLKRWATSRSYVFTGRWTKEFVRRRDLKQGDEIGLYWDRYYSRIHFGVLRRATDSQAKEH